MRIVDTTILALIVLSCGTSRADHAFCNKVDSFIYDKAGHDVYWDYEFSSELGGWYFQQDMFSESKTILTGTGNRILQSGNLNYKSISYLIKTSKLMLRYKNRDNEKVILDWIRSIDNLSLRQWIIAHLVSGTYFSDKRMSFLYELKIEADKILDYKCFPSPVYYHLALKFIELEKWDIVLQIYPSIRADLRDDIGEMTEKRGGDSVLSRFRILESKVRNNNRNWDNLFAQYMEVVEQTHLNKLSYEYFRLSELFEGSEYPEYADWFYRKAELINTGALFSSEEYLCIEDYNESFEKKPKKQVKIDKRINDLRMYLKQGDLEKALSISMSTKDARVQSNLFAALKEHCIMKEGHRKVAKGLELDFK